jgi:hypothetical protein
VLSCHLLDGNEALAAEYRGFYYPRKDALPMTTSALPVGEVVRLIQRDKRGRVIEISDGL